MFVAAVDVANRLVGTSGPTPIEQAHRLTGVGDFAQTDLATLGDQTDLDFSPSGVPIVLVST